MSNFQKIGNYLWHLPGMTRHVILLELLSDHCGTFCIKC